MTLRALLVTACLSLFAVSAGLACGESHTMSVKAKAAAASKPHLVVARAPLEQTVQDLLKARFIENVTCSRTCRMTTSAVIRPSAARKLGFKGVVAGKWVEIGTASRRLTAKKLTNVTISLNARAKKLLPRAKGGLQVLGRVDAAAAGNQDVRGAAAWIVSCSWR